MPNKELLLAGSDLEFFRGEWGGFSKFFRKF